MFKWILKKLTIAIIYKKIAYRGLKIVIRYFLLGFHMCLSSFNSSLFILIKYIKN